MGVGREQTEYQSVENGLRAHFTGLARTAGRQLQGAGTPDGGRAQLTALRAISVDLANLLTVVSGATQSHELDTVHELAPALRRYLNLASQTQLQQQLGSQFLALGQQNGDAAAACQGRLGLAWAYLRQGQLAQAAENAVAASRCEGLSDELRAEAMGLAGAAHYFQLDLAAAEVWLMQALELQRKLAQRHAEAAVLQNLGMVEQARTHFDVARDLLLESEALRHSIGDRLGEASAVNVLGGLEYRQGNYAESRECFERVREMALEFDDRILLTTATNNLANLDLHDGDLAGARAQHAQVLSMRRSLGDQYGQAASLNNLGLVELRAGDYSRARRYLRRALKLRRACGDRGGESGVLSNLGVTAFRMGDLRRARLYFAKSLAIRRKLQDQTALVLSVCETGALVAAVARSDEQRRTAATLLHGARHWSNQLRYRLDPIYTNLLEEGLAATPHLCGAPADQPLSLGELAHLAGAELRLMRSKL